MKKSFKNTKIINLALVAILNFGAFASSPKGIIEKVQGNVFVTRSGQTLNVGAGDYLYDFDEVITEVGSQVTFKDYFDHRFHLAGSGYVSILNKMIELKGGYLWVQNIESSKELFQVQTVNALTSYSNGEFIVSYDQDSGKTQLLSIKGTHLFSNIEQDFLKEEVAAGRFTFISQNYENGAPRIPTPIGASAYSAVSSLYNGVKPMNTDAASVVEDIARVMPAANKTARTIASVESDDKSGKMIFVKQEEYSDRGEILKNFYDSKVKQLEKASKPVLKKFTPDYKSKSNVSIKVYDLKTPSKRMPASVQTSDKKIAIRKPASMVELNPQVEVSKDAFEKSLIDQYKKQMRHSKEINSLINDLKSYEQDYKESY